MPNTLSPPEVLHVGDFGTELVVEFVEYVDGAWAPIDVSGADTLTIYITKPDRTVLTVEGAFDTDGTDGLVKYATVDTDVDMRGKWEIQGYATAVDGWTGSTRKGIFEVLPSAHGPNEVDP